MDLMQLAGFVKTAIDIVLAILKARAERKQNRNTQEL